MMFKELFQYLILHKELPVPGIGTFLLERKSALINFPEKEIKAPVYSVSMRSDIQTPEKKFYSGLGRLLHTGERETIIRFNDFIFDLKNQLLNGGQVNWNGVGVFNRTHSGEIIFVPEEELITKEKPVSAEKVIREKADHMVRVGEEEKTSSEMTEILNQQEERKSQWWVFAMIIGIVSVIFLGWYFSENGMLTSSTGNNVKVVPGRPAATYQVLP
jgi:hypothetical protein